MDMTDNGLTVIGTSGANGNVLASGTITAGTAISGGACSPLGATAHDTTGAPLYCINNVWKSLSFGPPPNSSASIKYTVPNVCAGVGTAVLSCSATTDAAGNISMPIVVSGGSSGGKALPTRMGTSNTHATIFGGMATPLTAVCPPAPNGVYQIGLCLTDNQGLTLAFFNQSSNGQATGVQNSPSAFVPWGSSIDVPADPEKVSSVVSASCGGMECDIGHGADSNGPSQAAYVCEVNGYAKYMSYTINYGGYGRPVAYWNGSAVQLVDSSCTGCWTLRTVTCQ